VARIRAARILRVARRGVSSVDRVYDFAAFYLPWSLAFLPLLPTVIDLPRADLDSGFLHPDLAPAGITPRHWRASAADQESTGYRTCGGTFDSVQSLRSVKPVSARFCVRETHRLPFACPGCPGEHFTWPNTASRCLRMPPGPRGMAPLWLPLGALAPLQRHKSMPGLRRSVMVRHPVTAIAARSRWLGIPRVWRPATPNGRPQQRPNGDLAVGVRGARW
jgi:hypothetical protein